MPNEYKLPVTDPSSPPATLIKRIRFPLATVVVSAGLVVSLIGGVYWLSGLLALAAIWSMMRYVQEKTSRHEQSLSLPPALVAMKQKLGSLALEPSLHDSAGRAQAQLLRLEAGHKQAIELLARKLDPSELAYSRFKSSLQSAAAAVFSELEDAVELLNQAALIGAKDPHAVAIKDAATKCLNENEKALGSFASALAAIASMKTNSSRVELPQAIEELEQIAARAKHLSLNKGDQNG